MGAKAYNRYVVTAQLMFLAERLRCLQGIEHNGEYPDGYGGVYFRFRQGVSLTSWGEDIEVHLYPCNDVQTVVDIVSKCSLPTQIVDWGKNSENINRILGCIFQGLMYQKVM